jgi:dipeptidyl aminopeptidase/acylaminoacyl peptidase
MKYRSVPFVLFLLASLVLAPASFAQDGDQPIVASDMLRIQQLSDVNVSPDGRSVLYSVRSIVEDDERDGRYRYVTQLWILEDGGRAQPRRLTSSRQGASQAAWHPDGDRIAFVRPVDGSPQIFVLSMLGGEAEQVTSFEHGASSPNWSPDGERLLFGVSLDESAVRELYGEPTWRTERPGRRPSPGDAEASPDGTIEEIRAWLDQQAAEGEPRVITRLDFQGEQDLSPQLSLRHHYLIYRNDDGSWSDPRAITAGWVSFSNAEWHPDGERILLSGWSEPNTHPDRERRNDIYITYVDEPRPRRLFSMEHHTIANPLIAPDGQTIAFVARDNRDPGYAQNQLGVFPLDAPNQYRILTENFDRSVGSPRWSPDNWYLYFTAAADGGFPLYRARVFEEPPAPPTDEEDENADNEEEVEEIVEQVTIERMTSTDTGIRSFDASTATLYYVKTRVENPFELYVSRAPFAESTRVTEHNASWLANRRISRPTHGTVQRDTLTIDYWMMPPTFAEQGRRYPLVVQIHGGPAAMWGPGEASMWHEFQFYASRGYAVVYSNPRGSGGYGYDFQRANFQDWGHGPAGDVLAVADAALDYPFVDAERQVVTGGSYAGYLTAWIITQDHRFRAAAAQRGVYDLPTFLGEGNAWRLVPSHFGGYPWEADPEFEPSPDDPWRPSPALAAQLLAAADAGDEENAGGTEEREMDEEKIADALADPSFREILIDNSPLTFVDQIRTPLLIKHGDQDLRTGVIQSEMLYRAMKLLDKDVEYARYPRAGHEMSRSGEPHHRMDRLLRIYEFMDRFVR